MYRYQSKTRSALTAGLSVLALSLALGCPDGDGDGDGDDGRGTFAIDDYDEMVTSTPATITGTKPSGSGVQVDGAERVAKGDATTWSVELDLVEGENSFALNPVDADGAAGAEYSVGITLDSIAPAVVSTSPAQGATDVPLNTAVNVELSEPPDCDTVSASVFSIQGVPAQLDCTTGSRSISLTPDAELAPQTLHTVTLFSDVADVAGNALTSDLVWQFTTGQAADTTPPVPPSADSPAPVSPSFLAIMDIGGSKEAGASVEMRWEVDSALQQDWIEIVAIDQESTWSHTFSLELGLNAISLRSVDGAGNVSTSTTDFTVQRDVNVNPVDPPTVDAVTTPTIVGNQVLSGTKPADTAIYDGATQLVPHGSATTWSALVQLSTGDNHLDIVAQDTSGNASDPVAVDISYTPLGAVPSGAHLTIDFDLRDLWNYVGDEMYFRDLAHGIEINHFGVDIWIEGPITPGEPCYFDDSTKQRLYTRYVGTLSHGRYEIPCQNDPGGIPCSGWWDLTNYKGANYLASLIEFGQWSSSTWPIAADVQRRDPATGEQWAHGVNGSNQPLHPQLHYPWQTTWGEWITRARMTQQPFIDGLTEATVDSGQAEGVGVALGSWGETRTYTWDLTDHSGAPVQQGPYLINILITVDRARNPGQHYGAILAADRETCWDDPAADDQGMHRAEGIIMIADGEVSMYLKEKAVVETVDACKWADSPYPDQNIKCTCGGGDAWPCPETPNSDPALIGERILYMDPAKYVNPEGDGEDYAVKLRYCPSASCP